MDVKLVMFKPSGQRKDFSLKKPLTVIGRGEECDLRIPLLAVSRKHCELAADEGKVKVKDLASSNGTYVNGKRVNETVVKAGDRVVVGPVVFTVQIDGVPQEIKPVKPRAAKAAAGADLDAEEVVPLEADVAAPTGGDELEALTAAAEDGGEELDPISALEALAAESTKKKQQGRKP